MADPKDVFPQNTPGLYYVDRSCIACDACCITAPDHFSMDEEGEYAFVSKQPQGKEEEELCREALEGCPVESIGNDGLSS